jgi:hypothetical protein
MERSHCSKEFEEYQENLNKQIEQISHCLSEKNLTNQEKRKCVLDYINKSLDPIFKCSNKKKQIKSRKQKSKIKPKQPIKQSIKQPIKQKSNINKPKQYTKLNINKQSNNSKSEQQPMQVSMGRFNTPISTETLGLYINSIKNK